mgnify:CR=1 FL=1
MSAEERTAVEMEQHGDVTVRAVGDVAEIEIHRPPANYFDVTLLGDLVAAVDRAAGEGARAAVICSEGRHFCAGLDFGSAGRPTPEALTDLYGHATALVAAPVPLVAAVQGAAIGGGLGLAVACDFRTAAPTSRFSANFTRLGFHQGFGLSVTLPAVVGSQRALDLLTTGRRIGGEEAQAIGLCDRLGEDPRAEAHALAAELAAAAPLAVAAVRATLRGDLVARFGAAVAHEREQQVRLMDSEDFGEGIAASLERRPPQFRGR